MREIEFRGKDKETKEWVYGSFFNTSPIYTIIENHGENTSDFHFIQNETLGQYVYRKDFDFNKIYTGDIALIEDYHGERVVKISSSGGTFYYTGDGYSDEYLFNAVIIKKLGNIHDNPELLEV